MNPALWGSLCALSLGSADFIARFSSRAIGHGSALLGMLATGCVVLSVAVWIVEPTIDWQDDRLWLVGLSGVATTAMTLLLYWGLARGPVSIVAPIVASHPALVVAFAVLLGHRPTAWQWLAMAAVLVGVAIVAASARDFERAGLVSRQAIAGTIAIACCSSVAYAVLVAAGQAAVPTYGELPTLWMSRLVSLAALLLVFAAGRRRPKLPLRWWPVLIAQGLLDAGGYLFLFAGSHGPDAAIAAVTGSTFAVVTTLLARLVLREPIGWLQWGGILLVVGGAAALSA